MTLSNQDATVSYTAIGNTGETFNIPFPFSADSEIFLLEAGSLQTQGTIYTLTGAGTSGGGTATYVGAPTAAATVIINRVVPLTQEADLKETGKFSAEAVEDSLDETVKMSQQSIQRNATDGNTFDAKGLRIVNAADPTGDQDVATKAHVAATVSGSGNVPAPLTADIGEHLEATAAGTFDWRITEEVPTPVAASVGKVLEATSAAVNGFSFQTVPAAGGRAVNLLRNGDMSVAQNGITFDSTTVPINNDITILLDGWRLLADGTNTVDVSQNSSVVPDGAQFSMLADVETANRKFGFVQVLEKKDTMRAFKNQTGVVSVSFEAHLVGTTVSTLRAGILSWVGTADQPTIEVVDGANWGAAGTDPTLQTSWAYENTPSNLALVASTWTTFTITNVALDTSGINNIALYIWVDDTDATVGDFLYISNVQMVIGDVVADFGHRPHAEELAICQRYLQVYPTGDANDPFCAGANTTDTENSHFIMPLVTTMLKTPTLVVGSAATDFEVFGADGSDAASAVAISTATPSSAMLVVTHTTVTVGYGLLLQAVSSAAKLTFVAEPTS